MSSRKGYRLAAVVATLAASWFSIQRQGKEAGSDRATNRCAIKAMGRRYGEISRSANIADSGTSVVRRNARLCCVLRQNNQVKTNVGEEIGTLHGHLENDDATLALKSTSTQQFTGAHPS
jgi:hypothetical protein